MFCGGNSPDQLRLPALDGQLAEVILPPEEGVDLVSPFAFPDLVIEPPGIFQRPLLLQDLGIPEADGLDLGPGGLLVILKFQDQVLPFPVQGRDECIVTSFRFRSQYLKAFPNLFTVFHLLCEITSHDLFAKSQFDFLSSALITNQNPALNPATLHSQNFQVR